MERSAEGDEGAGFPGYLFAQFALDKRMNVLKVLGVIDLVRIGAWPAEVDRDEIAALRQAYAAALPIEQLPQLMRGQAVRVIGGPMAGVEGTLALVKSQMKLVLAVTMMNRSVAVDGNVLTNQKPAVLQVDHLVQVSQIKPSDATFAAPCTPDGNSAIAKAVHLDGALSKLRGHFLLADKSKGKTFERVGDVNDQEVGTDIKVRGFVLPNRESVLPAEQVVYTEARKYILAASPCAGLIIGGAIVSTGIIVWPRNAAATPGTAATPISY